MLNTWFRLLRVKQWVKNLFLFLPIFFVLKITDTHLLMMTVLGFFSFCFLSSSIYILNDFFDREEDRLHPTKRNRPIASGKVAGTQVWVAFTLCLVVAFGLSVMLPPAFALIGAGYLVLNIGYSLGLKHIPVLDAFILAIGFLLRVQAGGAIGDIPVSMWLNLVTLLLALFIGFAKRRDDVLIYLKDGTAMRKSIQGYNLTFLDSALSILATATVVCYIMYTISPEVTARFGSDKLYFSTGFVLLGVLRYLQLAFVEKNTGDPTEIVLKDRFLQLTVLAWAIFISAILYFHTSF